MQEFILSDVNQMRAWAAEFAKQLKAPVVVALHGDLGMGKSEIARTVIQTLRGADTVVVLVFEFLTAGVIFSIISLIFELPTRGIVGYSLNTEQIIKIAYLAIMCTLFAQSSQMIGQKFTTANQSSIILSLEAVFGMLFSVLLGVEKISLWLGVGFAVVFVAILISEMDFDKIKFLSKRKDVLIDKTQDKGEDYGKE
jgi:drug/metabolite transporter (DMT)-like permease